MRKIALFISVFIFSGCVSTKIFNKTVGGLKAEFKTENAILHSRVRRLKQNNDELFAYLSLQARLGEQLTSAAKFFFDENKALRGEWILLGIRQAQVEKNLSDSRKKVKALKARVDRFHRELKKLEDK